MGGPLFVRARLALAVLALGLVTAVPVASAAAAPGPAPADAVPQRLLVTFHSSPPLSADHTLGAALAADGSRVVRRYATLPVVAVEATAAGRQALEASPDVASVVPDRRLVATAIPDAATPTSDPAAAQPSALPVATGAGWTVAVVDTGVDTTHPYLAGRSGTGVDGLGDGGACFADDCPGGTTSAVGTASAAPCAATGCDHGTHVAGIAVGDATKVAVSGVAGMAPGAGLYPVRVFSTSTDSSVCGSSVPCATAWEGDVLAGLDHVATEAAHYQFAAVNLSLGDSDTHPSVCSGVNVPIETAIGALRDAGIAVVASSGNHGTTASISFPACADGALPVGAVDASNHIAPFSDASPQVPLLMAPGTNILSSLPGGTFGRKSGTSMAAPAVSGAFALLRQAAPTATLASLVDLLRTTGPTVADTRPGATGATYPILDVNAALATLGFAAPAPVPAPAVNFHGLSTPQRLVDTRAGIGGVRLAAAATLTVAVPGVPSTATSMGAASLNVTAVGAAAPGFLTVYPCGQARPNVSSVNYVATIPVANKVVAAVPADGQVCIFTMSATDVVVDMDGWLPPDQPFHAVAPARVLDTRQTSGLLTDVVVPVAPAGSSGAVVNVTITDSRAAGYATLYPCGSLPLVSNVDFLAGATVPGAAMVPVDNAGELCVHTSTPAHIIVDVAGWLDAGFAPIVPFRSIDTRLDGAPVTDIAVLPGLGAVAGIAMTLTVTQPTAAGYATVYPCGQVPPLVSNVDFVAGQTIANAVVATPDAEGRICVHSLVPTHLVIDVSGSFS